MMEGFSLAHFIIYKRRGSFYHDLVHIIGWFHSIMDEIHVIESWYSVRNRSDSFDHSNEYAE